MLDPALLRPGRFDKILLVTTPDELSRLNILEIHTKKVPLAKNVNLKELAKMSEGYSGADLEALVREAAMLALRENMNSEEVTNRHFLEAIKKVRASVSKGTVEVYKKIEDKYLKNVKAGVDNVGNYFG